MTYWAHVNRQRHRRVAKKISRHMMIPFLAPLSVTFALAGGGCALLAALCRGKPWSNKINELSYAFMGISISLFILRGFLA